MKRQKHPKRKVNQMENEIKIGDQIEDGIEMTEEMMKELSNGKGDDE